MPNQNQDVPGMLNISHERRKGAKWEARNDG